MKKSFFCTLGTGTLLLLISSFSSIAQSSTGSTFKTVSNSNGPTLGYSPESGITILTVEGRHFKDLNKNGKLDVYEDWRLPVDTRAKDLAARMSVEQIAGLMLYSAHQSIPAAPKGFGAGTYNGKPIDSSGMQAYAISDQQKKFLQEDNLRHILVTRVQSPGVAAQWNNNVQAFVEGLGLGIPANNSSDPRNGVVANAEYNLGAGGTISMWPESIGLAATFDPAIVLKFGQVAGQEYRALGIATALSPQVDLATEPRWNRFSGTFGENPKLAADMAKAYVDGFQTSSGAAEIKDGWGFHSVNAMVKHWPGGGPEEGGRDGHFAYGKFAVYPGKNFNTQLAPFIDGAFKLDGKTRKAAAVMPYYTISYNQDTKYGENVGNGYSKFIVTDLLRNKYGYDGVVCTDWLVTGDEGKTPDVFWGKSWGAEKLTIAERHYKVLMAGLDQFGGNNDARPVMEAYNMGVKEHGEAWMRKRFEQSAVRLLRNILQVGLFENPYLDVAASVKTTGNAAFMQAGYDAQLKSIVLLKNKNNVLPLAKTKTIYIPKRTVPAARDWFGNMTPEREEYPVNIDIVKKYFNVTDDPAKADIALVLVKGPNGGVGYEKADRDNGGNGYVPISLQYGPYTAAEARSQSIAAGDPVIDPTITNRTYKGKTTTASNTKDLQLILDTKTAMNGRPVIVSMALSNPAVVAEFESKIEGLLVTFGVQDQALMDILSGATEPSGLLPLQMPANMLTVETQQEDVPQDMQPHKDSEGNVYDFAFGLNWKGVIKDVRTGKYGKK
ncbi:glycoside hydrolase family 3 C-terminal domain-containing protein [Panacibacter sp. DH6]|uniref:beta-glucosidase n=1 Tax=Panacibacter microcysteis TaxID=2793269 RepID=A0A931GYM6_9BACT|nr:glycoside hydrolase family 3 N-terminal domain-containing protein [Panacibacter microcysteis]MBG9376797.1 glycoside hydrolase family 3 C-terminal domain-containing protein [Panacibacter microcysteis]